MIYPIVKEKTFPAEKYSEQNRILLSLLCVGTDALPQGAPTSPTISNIIMRDFDKVTGIVVNEKVSVNSEYKRKIRQEMHYCMKYGVDSHLTILCYNYHI